VETTWDGLPVAPEPPFAACVVVWREGVDGREFLVLHRLAPGGAGYEGEWAWTPPAGARQPGEEADEAARRELYEETGLALGLVPAPGASATEEVALYVAQASPGDEIRLDPEHDRFEWLPLDAALDRCLPLVVAQGLANAAAWLDAAAERQAGALRNRHETGTHERENPR
jgi:8-oxo-dGTP pyrophosphatase MutT (NUDIX family)